MRTLFLLFIAATGSASLESVPPQSGSGEVRTPEGFIRIEGPRVPGGATGTFGVYPAATYGRAPAPPPSAEAASPAGATARAPEGAAARAALDPCRRERNRYLRRLLQMQGIDLEDPLAVLDGLSGPGGYPGALLFSAYGLLPGVDPVHPLAWDFELKSLARELAACASAARASAR